MNVYVGMDVHRKRSQIAVLNAAGDEERNRNVPNDPDKRCRSLVCCRPACQSRWRPEPMLPATCEATRGFGFRGDYALRPCAAAQALASRPSRCASGPSLRCFDT